MSLSMQKMNEYHDIQTCTMQNDESLPYPSTMLQFCTNALSAGRAGGTPFVYQSGTRRNKGSKSYMEGFFTFVEGTIQAPTGPQFDVQVRLPFQSMAASLALQLCLTVLQSAVP